MSPRTLQHRSGLIRLMRPSFDCGALYCCDPHRSVREDHFGNTTPDSSEIADQPVLAKFGVGGPWPRKMTTAEPAAVIHCYPTQMEATGSRRGPPGDA
jgi:hypothetical protein